jgi:hypothetical protein
VICIVLGAEYWVVERPRETAPVEEETRPPFLDVDPDTLREVRMTRGGRRLVSRREAGAWTVVEPAGAAVPPDLIAAFANALAGAAEIARVAGAGADAREYGLDERAARVELIRDGGVPVVVNIGEPNPTGTAVYARRAGGAEIVLIGRNVRYYEDLIFQALSAGQVPAADENAPVGSIDARRRRG